MIKAFRDHLDRFTDKCDNEIFNVEHYIQMAIDYADYMEESTDKYIEYAELWYLSRLN